MMESEYRDLAFVPRWSIIRQIKSQSVAEHSFYVALYAEQLARYLDWEGDVGVLLTMALRHDLEECFTGDIVGPCKAHFVDKERHHNYVCTELNKRFNLHLRVITPQEELEINGLIKMADGIDECMYLAGEMQMGNMSVRDVYKSRLEALSNKLFETIINIFKRSESEASSKTNSIMNIIRNTITTYSKVVE